ncbi:MAG TPA: thermopsin family protease, partial [Thermoplasmata archaeon]|nr:thermopsin family protease [Thermoplasmata archaeon]
DFGVSDSGSLGAGYAYSSPSFQGTAAIKSMSVTISGSSSKVTAFELNAVVILRQGTTNYSYWIQNGLHLDASSHEFTIGGAYVWNFSTPGALLHSGELKGNSSSVLASDTYYFIPGCGPSFPGQCSTVTLPTTLVGRIQTASANGVPYVDYEYNLGAGWVVYDNVSFLHLGGAVVSGFHVDGFHATPYASGAFYDAEWVWVGAGGGSGSVDLSSDINLSLDYWNGHNYQAVPTAWDFGGNTGETASSVVETYEAGSNSGPEAHVASGAGALGILYNRTLDGFANITVPTSSLANLTVDRDVVSFNGGWANLTLRPGVHSVSLQGYSNSSLSVTIFPDQTTFVNLSGAGRVVFYQSGLPAGTSWAVSIGGNVHLSTARTVEFHLPNGTYSVSYTPEPGFRWSGTAPTSISLPGTSQVMLGFVRSTYSVAVTESGLPDGTSWWVNANGTIVRSSGTSLQVSEPNGSTMYEVGGAYEFVASPENGTLVVVAGVPEPVLITFSYRASYISGSVTPSDAQVLVGGIPQPVTFGNFSADVIPGSYEISVSASGFVTQWLNVTATPGNVTWANFTLVLNQTPSTPPPETSQNTIPATTVLLVVAAVAAGAVLAGVLILRRRR